MDIRNIRELKNTAAQRLEQASEAKKIVLIYSLISILSGLLVTVITYCLELQVDQLGGLGNMGTRSFLSTISAVLPMVLNMALLCLELGYLAAMLRIGRGMYTSPWTLKAGVPRFWAMLRTNILLYGMLFMLSMGAFYLAAMIFVMLPSSNAVMELLMPMMSSADPTALILDPAVEASLMSALMPLFVIFGIAALVLVLPLTYHYRMANYVLLHNPRAGALVALGASKRMMRGNRLALLKIDLSLWWYYGLSVLSMVVCYGGELLAMFGIPLPLSEGGSFFLFYILSLGILFLSNILFRNKVGVIYAMFFDAVRPKEENTGGVVLGNIFQM
jgi:uncharacterized membrane protein